MSSISQLFTNSVPSEARFPLEQENFTNVISNPDALIPVTIVFCGGGGGGGCFNQSPSNSFRQLPTAGGGGEVIELRNLLLPKGTRIRHFAGQGGTGATTNTPPTNGGESRLVISNIAQTLPTGFNREYIARGGQAGYSTNSSNFLLISPERNYGCGTSSAAGRVTTSISPAEFITEASSQGQIGVPLEGYGTRRSDFLNPDGTVFSYISSKYPGGKSAYFYQYLNAFDIRQTQCGAGAGGAGGPGYPGIVFGGGRGRGGNGGDGYYLKWIDDIFPSVRFVLAPGGGGATSSNIPGSVLTPGKFGNPDPVLPTNAFGFGSSAQLDPSSAGFLGGCFIKYNANFGPLSFLNAVVDASNVNDKIYYGYSFNIVLPT